MNPWADLLVLQQIAPLERRDLSYDFRVPFDIRGRVGYGMALQGPNRQIYNRIAHHPRGLADSGETFDQGSRLKRDSMLCTRNGGVSGIRQPLYT